MPYLLQLVPFAVRIQIGRYPQRFAEHHVASLAFGPNPLGQGASLDALPLAQVLLLALQHSVNGNRRL